MATSIIEITNVKKSFQVGTQEVPVLKGVSAKINMGDFVIIVGPSGCGKSTLLHIILGLEHPSEGNIIFLGENIYDNTTEDYRSDFRKKHIGMVYQQPNWVKSMTVAENVAFPMLLLGMETDAALERARELLTKLKMTDWADYMPSELSGGQQQRVSLARALANNPEIIIADEPTGNLDYQTGQEVMQMLQDLNTKEQKTVVMVTHDLEYLKFANTAIKIFDGLIDAVYTGNQINDLFQNSKQKRGVGEVSISTATGAAVRDQSQSRRPPEPAAEVEKAPAVATTPAVESKVAAPEEKPEVKSAVKPAEEPEVKPATTVEEKPEPKTVEPPPSPTTTVRKPSAAAQQPSLPPQPPAAPLPESVAAPAPVKKSWFHLPWQKSAGPTASLVQPSTSNAGGALQATTAERINATKPKRARSPRTLPKRLKLT